MTVGVDATSSGRAARFGRAWFACLAALGATALGGCGSEPPGPDPGRASQPRPPSDARPSKAAPNVVLVITDDQDAASLRFMRHVREDLGRSGVTYRNAFATVPECCPSRVSFLTGQHAHNHGVLSNTPPEGGFDAFDDANTLPVWLRAGGYRTGFVGKYLNGYGWTALDNDPRYVPPGWDRWAALTNHTEYGLYDYDLNIDGAVVGYGSDKSDYQTDVLSDLAVEALAEMTARERPFFLTVAPVAPHDEGALEGQDVARNPRPAPRHRGRFAGEPLPRPLGFNESDVADKPRFIQGDELLSADEISDLETLYRSRIESLLAVDEMVHRLRERVRRAGALSETLFVFTSDNGYLLGEHRQFGKAQLYEPAVRIPLVVSGPGFARGTVSDDLVANIDFAPTVLDLAGIEARAVLDGIPLAGSQTRDALLLAQPTGNRAFAAVRTRRHVLAQYDRGVREAYDLRGDPFQLENLGRGPESRALLHRLEATLDELRDCAGSECSPREG